MDETKIEVNSIINNYKNIVSELVNDKVVLQAKLEAITKENEQLKKGNQSPAPEKK